MKRVISEINIFPVKSLGGIPLEEAQLTERGLEYDRRWMLINERNQFLTIRQHPEFLFFKLQLTPNGFIVSKKGDSNELTIPFSLQSGDIKNVTIWDDTVEAIVADEDSNQWFSNKVGFNCQLVYLPDTSPRRVQPEWVKEENHVSLADGYPYLMVGQSSVDDLNSKIEEEITTQRFRPNIVVKGSAPYEEYLWKDMTIGSAQLKGIKPCTRCIVTTMNPQTAVKGKEPLKALFKQRVNDKMIFGQNTIMTKAGVIKLGDELIINSTKQSPYEPV